MRGKAVNFVGQVGKEKLRSLEMYYAREAKEEIFTFPLFLSSK